MSDARSLLRQQRAARRITHPNAAYSETGKLLCTLCREQVKAESLWDAHIAGETHKKRQALAAPPQQGTKTREDTDQTASHKRKLEDNEMDLDGGDQAEDAARRKRTRSDAASGTPDDDGKDRASRDQSTPVSAPRRSSQTPSQGVELQIPSRPATPRDSATMSSASSATTTALPSRQLAPETATRPSSATAKPAPTTTQDRVDEDEWAAFEAEIAAADSTAQSYGDATITAAAMTAEESARRKAEEEEGGAERTLKPEIDLADEREDAQRALEEEFDEMRDLEAKVLRLKERRDALRQRAASHSQENGGDATAGVKGEAAAAAAAGKENSPTNGVAVQEEEVEKDGDADEDASEEDDEDDDWDGFRFRTALAR